MKKRDRILKDMGFDSYREYLDSELWQEIRDKVFALKGRRCSCCNKQAKVVHHLTYNDRNMRGESVQSLELTMFPLCHGCHKKVHFRGEVFRSLRSARQSMLARRKKPMSKHKRKLRRAMVNQKSENDKLAAETDRLFR